MRRDILHPRLTAFAFALLAVAACAPDKADFEFAITPGLYDVAAPVCVSTGEAPEYPAANYKAVLFDFTDLTSHTLEIQPARTLEIMQDSDCTLTVERSVYQNEAGSFSMRHDRRHSFEPEGCSMQLVWDDRTFDVSLAYGDIFADSADRSEELPYTPTPTEDGGIALVTRDDPELNLLWAAYGCADSDRVSQRLESR